MTPSSLLGVYWCVEGTYHLVSRVEVSQFGEVARNVEGEGMDQVTEGTDARHTWLKLTFEPNFSSHCTVKVSLLIYNSLW
jgi:peptide methionine sulfoxide reductase MsrA